MTVKKQIEKGIICSPSSKKILHQKDGFLQTGDKTEKYPIVNDIPCFIEYENIIPESKNDSKMLNEYKTKTSFTDKIRRFFNNDYRKPRCNECSKEIFEKNSDELVFLSIGGGPQIKYTSLTNINIDIFDNVHMVADGHNLPYIDNSVDAIFCEAVLEHVREPEKIVNEMFRVLKKDGLVHSFVPFMAAYHGYPHHYQNFTLDGHKYLYTRNKFTIIEADTAVGPTYTIISSIATYLAYYIPNKYISLFFRSIWFVIGGMIRPLDKIIVKNKNSHILSTATYLIAKKEIK